MRPALNPYDAVHLLTLQGLQALSDTHVTDGSSEHLPPFVHPALSVHVVDSSEPPVQYFVPALPHGVAASHKTHSPLPALAHSALLSQGMLGSSVHFL